MGKLLNNLYKKIFFLLNAQSQHIPQLGHFDLGFLSDDIRLHRFRFSFAHAPPLSHDVLIYRPVRNFKKTDFVLKVFE